jgi:hypothetical protein
VKTNAPVEPEKVEPGKIEKAASYVAKAIFEIAKALTVGVVVEILKKFMGW